MKPIQTSLRKQSPDWNDCKAWVKVTGMINELEKIKSNPENLLNWNKVKHTIATLLVEYYEILFNPQYRNVFWYDSTHSIDQLKNLTLLFPINDPISISYSTNFILLPLPIPTYEERTHKWTHKKNCPFLRFDEKNPITDQKVDTLLRVNELVRDMDYSIDSNIIKVSSSSNSPQRNKKVREKYEHTNPDTKLRRTNQTLPRNEARLWSYKYKDVPKRIAERLPKDYETGWYSIRDIWRLMYTDKDIKERKNKQYFTRNALTIKNQQYIKNKIVLLEIPPQIWKRAHKPHNEKLFYKLEDYSRTYLTDTMFTWNEFWKYFDFSYTKATKEEVIDYFVKHALPMNEYNALQIKTGITRLKNMIKDYNHKYPDLSVQQDQSTSKEELDNQLDLTSPYYQTWRWRPNRDYLNTHGAKYYRPDWTVIEFETYNEREIYKKSKEQLTNLYSNQQSTWTTQQSSQQ